MVRLTLADVSKYLTRDVIEEAFKLRINSDDHVQSIKVTRAAPAGEGLLSAVYRIHVTGDEYSVSFIAKGLVNDLLLRKSLDCSKYFEREALFFSKILPVLVELQESLGAKECIQNSVPKLYSCHLDGTNDYILMEDLTESDCRSMSKIPTLHERDMTLTVLAHLHAVSIALRIKKPDEFANIEGLLPEVYYTEDNREWYSKFLQKAVAVDKDALSQYEDSSSIYYQRFSELLNGDVYGLLIELLSKKSEHRVFNHGDAWCPNFLCSKRKAVGIDFQLVRCASPASDLAYFLFLCSHHHRTKEDYTKAVDVYYHSVAYYLKDMGIDNCTVFSQADLFEELMSFGKLGILSCLTTIPLLAGERLDVLKSTESKFDGLETIPLEDLWELTPINNEEYKMRLVNAVRVAVDLGMI